VDGLKNCAEEKSRGRSTRGKEDLNEKEGNKEGQGKTNKTMRYGLGSKSGGKKKKKTAWGDSK